MAQKAPFCGCCWVRIHWSGDRELFVNNFLHLIVIKVIFVKIMFFAFTERNGNATRITSFVGN